MTNFPEPMPTGEVCPACCEKNGSPGDGVIRSESGPIHRAVQCSLCEGTTWLRKDDPRLREWYARNARKE